MSDEAVERRKLVASELAAFPVVLVGVVLSYSELVPIRFQCPEDLKGLAFSRDGDAVISKGLKTNELTQAPRIVCVRATKSLSQIHSNWHLQFIDCDNCAVGLIDPTDATKIYMVSRYSVVMVSGCAVSCADGRVQTSGDTTDLLRYAYEPVGGGNHLLDVRVQFHFDDHSMSVSTNTSSLDSYYPFRELGKVYHKIPNFEQLVPAVWFWTTRSFSDTIVTTRSWLGLE